MKVIINTGFNAFYPARPLFKLVGLALPIFIMTGCVKHNAFVKKNLVYTAYEQNLKECAQEARGTEAKKSPNTTGMVTTGGFIGGLGSGIAQGVTAGQVQNWYYQDCLEQRGYRKALLTEEESDRFKALKTNEQKTRFLNNIYEEVANGTRKTL